MSSITIEQLNRFQYDVGCSYNVGKYLRSSSIEVEVAQILANAGVNVATIDAVCDTIVDHFAVAHYLEDDV